MSIHTIGVQNKQLKPPIFHISVQYERNNIMYLDILTLPKIYTTFHIKNGRIIKSISSSGLYNQIIFDTSFVYATK
jgi:hypothetical protein